ncbi:MAG: pantoate--beta-alanine ligase [bacterium]|nr:MAG: pantoate--beta-alanine ligase [bacterium]
MKIFEDIPDMQKFAESVRKSGKRIGLVPTMGYLHEGHLSLIRNIRKSCDVVVVSVFVNPTQFGIGEDLNKYPRDFKRDQELCRKENVDIVFYPEVPKMYPEGYDTYITVEKFSGIMCGVSRPTHFQGVTTVVAKLFNIVKPHIAIFGEKDYQQAIIIKKMVQDLNFDIVIETSPIIRESDGLALSSRNKYLNKNDRKNAVLLYQSLQHAKKLFQKGERDILIIKQEMAKMILQIPNARIDYIEIVAPDTLRSPDQIQERAVAAVAVFIGKTRLIDNLLLEQ